MVRETDARRFYAHVKEANLLRMLRIFQVEVGNTPSLVGAKMAVEEYLRQGQGTGGGQGATTTDVIVDRLWQYVDGRCPTNQRREHEHPRDVSPIVAVCQMAHAPNLEME